jgi:hypothetical protein
MSRHTRKRITVAAAVGLATAALWLIATIGASARDGHRGHAGGQATPTRIRQQAARKDDGHEGQGEDGEQQGRLLLASTLAPSVPADPAIHGVAAGGLPWVLEHGSVRLTRDGSIRIVLEGLVIPIAHGTFPAGSALPVTTVSASLYCAPDASAAAATTQAVPISATGNATIAETITVPATCLAPIVLVHPNGGAAAYIAASGWSS